MRKEKRASSPSPFNACQAGYVIPSVDYEKSLSVLACRGKGLPPLFLAFRGSSPSRACTKKKRDCSQSKEIAVI